MLIDHNSNASQTTATGGNFLHGEVIVRLSESEFNRDRNAQRIRRAYERIL